MPIGIINKQPSKVTLSPTKDVTQSTSKEGGKPVNKETTKQQSDPGPSGALHLVKGSYSAAAATALPPTDQKKPTAAQIDLTLPFRMSYVRGLPKMITTVSRTDNVRGYDDVHNQLLAMTKQTQVASGKQQTKGHTDLTRALHVIKGCAPAVRESKHLNYFPAFELVKTKAIDSFGSYLKQNTTLASISSAPRQITVIRNSYRHQCDTISALHQRSLDVIDPELQKRVREERDAFAETLISNIEKNKDQLAALHKPAEEQRSLVQEGFEAIKGSAIRQLNEYINEANTALGALTNDLGKLRQDATIVSYLKDTHAATGFMDALQLEGTLAMLKNAEHSLQDIYEDEVRYVRVLDSLIEVVATGGSAVKQHIETMLDKVDGAKKLLISDFESLVTEAYVYLYGEKVENSRRILVLEAKLERLRDDMHDDIAGDYGGEDVSVEAKKVNGRIEAAKLQRDKIDLRLTRVFNAVTWLKDTCNHTFPFPPDVEDWKRREICYWDLPDRKQQRAITAGPAGV